MSLAVALASPEYSSTGTMLMFNSVAEFDGVDAVLSWATRQCLEFGLPVAPRHQPTYELLGASFVLSNPRARIPSSPERRWSLPLALGEFCWHLRGASDLGSLAYYAPRWRRYSDDGRTVTGSCYGKAAFGGDPGFSQWSFVKEILRSDPASRRAVLIFDQPKTTDAVTVDKACLTSMQFLIREDRLHAVVSMRSNDVFLGVPYDVFNFTMLHELMALDVGVELGSYVHFAGSLHLYETDIERAKRSFLGSAADKQVMAPIPSVESARSFAQIEAAIREGDASRRFGLDKFWSPYVAALEEFRSARLRTLVPTRP